MAEDFLTFGIGANGEDVNVRDWDALDRWIAKERALWEWLRPGDGVTDVHGMASNVQNTWNSIVNQIASVRGPDVALINVASYLAPLNAGGSIFASESKEGTLILEIREKGGDIAASFAYGFLKRQVGLQNARIAEELFGAILTAVPELGQPAEIAHRLNLERTNYRNAVRSGIDAMDQAAKAQDQRFDAAIGRGKRIAARMLRQRRDKWKAVQGSWQQMALDAVASIKGVENAYLEAMRLQAPVKYWQDKATEHQRRENWAVGRLAVFFPAALAGLGWAFWEAGSYLIENASPTGSQSPLSLYIVIGGGLAALATLVFWIGRLLTKLYLSEHHLRNDANERAVMTQTYLALTKESAADVTDRQIVLNALFRATPDGIVKDQGPADLNLQTLLAGRLAS